MLADIIAATAGFVLKDKTVTGTGTSTSNSQNHSTGFKDSGDRLAFTQTQSIDAVVGNGCSNLLAALQLDIDFGIDRTGFNLRYRTWQLVARRNLIATEISDNDDLRGLDQGNNFQAGLDCQGFDGFLGNRGDNGFSAFQADMNLGIHRADKHFTDDSGKLITCTLLS